MAGPGSSSSNSQGIGLDEHGNATPVYYALREVLARAVASLPTGPPLTSRAGGSVTPSRVDFSLTSVEHDLTSARSRTEQQIFPPTAQSPITTATSEQFDRRANSRMATRAGGNHPDSSPTMSIGFGHETGENEGRQAFNSQTDVGRNLHSGDSLSDPDFLNCSVV